jgi:hypothetical protein
MIVIFSTRVPAAGNCRRCAIRKGRNHFLSPLKCKLVAGTPDLRGSAGPRQAVAIVAKICGNYDGW